MTTLGELFWRKVDAAGDCWLWTSQVDRHGYGKFSARGGNFIAHRMAWTLLMGKAPAGLELDHLCRVRLCVNPDHLEPVTQRENLRRIPRLRRPAASYRRVYHHLTDNDFRFKCDHSRALGNVYVSPDGRRHCRECRRLSDKRRRPRWKAA